MTRKEIKKEKKGTTALLVCTIFAILINLVAVFLNLRLFILGLLAVPQVFDSLSFVFTLLSAGCVILLSTFVPGNLKTIRNCNEYLDKHPEDPNQ